MPAVPELATLLRKDKDALVRETAAHAFLKLGHYDPVLLGALKDDDARRAARPDPRNTCRLRVKSKNVDCAPSYGPPACCGAPPPPRVSLVVRREFAGSFVKTQRKDLVLHDAGVKMPCATSVTGKPGTPHGQSAEVERTEYSRPAADGGPFPSRRWDGRRHVASASRDATRMHDAEDAT